MDSMLRLITSLIIQRKMDKLGSVTSKLYDTPFYRGI